MIAAAMIIGRKRAKRVVPTGPKPWEGRKEVLNVNLTIARPPSVNKAYANVPGIGRIKSKAYKDWLTVAMFSVQAQHPGCVRGTYHLEIIAERSNKLADLGNLEKLISDLLVTTGVVEDDRFCSSYSARWRGEGTLAYLRVTSTRGE